MRVEAIKVFSAEVAQNQVQDCKRMKSVVLFHFYACFLAKILSGYEINGFEQFPQVRFRYNSSPAAALDRSAWLEKQRLVPFALIIPFSLKMVGILRKGDHPLMGTLCQARSGEH